MRIYGLEHYFKRGLFFYHPTQYKFFNEYVSFPRAILRDILDAISFQVDEWEKVFSIQHSTGGNRRPEDIRRLNERARERIRKAWGRKKR